MSNEPDHDKLMASMLAMLPEDLQYQVLEHGKQADPEIYSDVLDALSRGEDKLRRAGQLDGNRLKGWTGDTRK